MFIHAAVTLTSKLFVSLLVSFQGMRQNSSNEFKYSKSRQLSHNLLGCECAARELRALEDDYRGSGRCHQCGITAAAVEVITKFAYRGSGRLEIGFRFFRNGGFTNMLMAPA